MKPLYSSNRFYVNTSQILSINDNKKKIFVVNKDNKLLTLDDGKIIYENVEEVLPEKILLEQAITQEPDDDSLYLFKIKKIAVETNDVKLFLDTEIYHSINLMIKRILRLLVFYPSIYIEAEGTLSIKVLKKKHGFIELFICIKNHIIGPMMLEEFINGYYDFYVKTIINPRTRIGIHEIKFLRQIEYKRLFKITKKDKKHYIDINGISYEIDEEYHQFKDNIVKINEDMYIRFAYAKIKYKDDVFYNYKTFFPYANYNIIEFFDIDLNKIFRLKNEHLLDLPKKILKFNNNLYKDIKDSTIKNINIVSYLFYDNYSRYGFIKSEDYTTNLTFNIVPDLEMLTTNIYDS